jgi:superfamily II DNA or RNA helicase
MRFTIASAQTLARRTWPKADVIIVDESHTLHSAWVNHIQETDAKVIGLSATPFSKGLGLLFSNLINAATMKELTESGVLVPMRIMSCTKINMTGAATRCGEWTEQAAAERGMEILGDVVKEWQEHTPGEKTIVFGSTIAHCEEMAKAFNAAGIRAACFTSETTKEEREKLLKDFNNPIGLLKVLISVEALAKGFDSPLVTVICDLRPLRKSLSTFIQMCGRGARSAPGKTHFTLLDFSGNIIRFAEDFEQIYNHGLEALDMGEKLDTVVRQDNEEKKPSECPSCGNVPFAKKCMKCGYEKKSVSLVEHVPGVMQEVIFGKQKAADNLTQLYQMCCTYARSKSQKPEGYAYHLFHGMTGQKPPISYIMAQNTQISQAVMNKIISENIKYSRSLKSANG